jgi:hypothetical protein
MTQMNRRDFMKQGAMLGAGAAAVGAGLGHARGEEKKKGMPHIRLGSLEISRMILGSNPFWGYSHKNSQLDREMREFHTDERIVAILDEAAACGVTAVASPPEPRWIELWTKYKKEGGKLAHWISQCHLDPGKIPGEIERSGGIASAMFIQGHRVEQQFDAGKWDVLTAWLEQIRKFNVPAGLASHYPEVHLEAEKRGLPADFYYQCFYNVTKSGEWAEGERTQAVKTVQAIEKKPVIAYKILAAGRLAPEAGFEFALKNIRPKDGVCVGIFIRDGVDQIRQNTLYTELYS